jgi:hypothetical protein
MEQMIQDLFNSLDKVYINSYDFYRLHHFGLWEEIYEVSVPGADFVDVAHIDHWSNPT